MEAGIKSGIKNNYLINHNINEIKGTKKFKTLNFKSLTKIIKKIKT